MWVRSPKCKSRFEMGVDMCMCTHMRASTYLPTFREWRDGAVGTKELC